MVKVGFNGHESAISTSGVKLSQSPIVACHGTSLIHQWTSLTVAPSPILAKLVNPIDKLPTPTLRPVTLPERIESIPQGSTLDGEMVFEEVECVQNPAHVDSSATFPAEDWRLARKIVHGLLRIWKVEGRSGNADVEAEMRQQHLREK